MGLAQQPHPVFSPPDPALISPQDTVGEVELDPLFFFGEVAVERQLQRFVFKLNLWRSPAESDCFIHNNHPVIVSGTNQYPWHRYFADTDQVWLAIELHQIS
ncbi:hypothetical protein [Mesorhizobium sp. M0488]|uniref:hypothetical protein n=1 Tax=unclassified Mesorhizobium TaxID=325217 RepID=UPI00333BC397